jgi:chemotaxis signal transduction protein
MAATTWAPVERRDLGTQEEGQRQYLTFHLDGERYGLDILKVQEIRDWAMGLVVDDVPDILKVRTSRIQSAPDLGSVVETAFISGLIALETGMTRLLDLDGLLGRVKQLATQMLCANDSVQGMACPYTHSG